MDEDNQNTLAEDATKKQNLQYIITKFMRNGFHGLAVEDLAMAILTPDFKTDFKQQTGSDWVQKYEVKALERLTHAQFDLHWMTRRTNDEHNFLFANIIKGNLDKVREFVRKAGESCHYAVDLSKKSPLHIAAKQGQTTIAEYLVNKGFNINSRDRTLKTPLHEACLYSQETIAEIFANAGADLLAKDGMGRLGLHYAACSSSPSLLMLFLARRRDLVNESDNLGRGPLHYCIWNSSSKQIDLIRTLLDQGADINKQDTDGKTPLHHAAEGGRTRVIPILLQRGANVGIKDKISYRTALDMAANDRTRELIIVYSAAPYTKPNDNKENTFQMIKGVKPIVHVKGKNERIKEEPQIPIDNKIGSPMPNFIREQFFFLMKQVQERGVLSNQHFKRPYLYSGSWLEGVKSLEELFNRIKDIPFPSEAVIRTFNILCPYEKSLPKATGDEEAVDKFYGDPWFDGQSIEDKFLNKININEEEEKIKALEQALEIARNQIAEYKNFEQQMQKLQSENASLISQLQISKQDSETFKNQLIKNNEIFEQFKLATQTEIERLTRENEEYLIKKREDSERDDNLREIQLAQEANLQEKYEMEELLRQEKAKELLQRKKVGEIFLRAIEHYKQNKVVVADKQLRSVEGIENFQDDQAIINLFKALRNNPPPLKKRLQQCDKDGDNALTQQEFTQFCKRLGLSEIDIYSLCRVAGYLDGAQMVTIDDFILILEERPKMRELWEKKLFKRILRELDKKKLSIERFFQLIDVNDDSEVSPHEFKAGLENLRIILNQKDVNNLFTIFDQDKSGSINLREVQATLEIYRQMPDDDEVGGFEDRFQRGDENIDDFDEEKGNEQLSLTDKLKALEDEDIKVSEDMQLLKGDLKVQIPYAKDLIVDLSTLKEIIVRIRLRGALETDICKEVILFDVSQWRLALRIPIRNQLRENLSDDMVVQLFTSEVFEQENFLGEVNLQWKGCFDNPEKWEINYEFSLENVSYKDTKDPKQIKGVMGLQVIWIPSSSNAFKDSIQDFDLKTKKSFITPIVEDGRLEATIVSAFLSQKQRQVKAEIKLPFDKQQECEANYDAKNNPYWFYFYLIINQFEYRENLFVKEMNIKSEQALDSIQLKIFTEKSKMMGLSKETKVLGEILINWKECLLFPCRYLANKAFLFYPPQEQSQVQEQNDINSQQNFNVPSKIYIKIRWIPKSEYNKYFLDYQELSSKEKKARMKRNLNLGSGLLKVLIVRAKYLQASDSDPYCILKYQGPDDIDITQKTIHKKKTLNPEWISKIQPFLLNIKYAKDLPKPPLQLTVMDYDVMPGGDDRMGTALVDLTPAFDNPCSWAINHYFQLNLDVNQNQEEESKKFEQCQEGIAQIYVQCYFVPEGEEDQNIIPVDKEGKLSLIDTDMVNGQFKVNLIHARELRKADSGLGGQLSDPYCEITFPDKLSKKSTVRNNTVNPVWKESFVHEIKNLSKENLPPIKISIFDSDFGSSDDLLGFVNIEVLKCLEQPGKWAINEVFKVEGTADILGANSSLGYIYLQIKFLEEGMADNNQEPQLIENLEDKLAAQQGIYKGKLKIFMIHAKEIPNLSKDNIKPYAKLKIPGGKVLEKKPQTLQEISKQNFQKTKFTSMVWKTIYESEILMPRDAIQPLRVEIWRSEFFGDDLISYQNIQLDNCFKEQNSWAINQVFDLDGSRESQDQYQIQSFGQLYLQVMFEMQGETSDEKVGPLVTDIDEELRQQILEQEQPIKGILRIILVMARGLKIADQAKGGTCDPYCEIVIPDGKNGKRVSTTKCYNTLNPIWNFDFNQPIDLLRKNYKNLRFNFYDEDKLARDDSIGYLDIDWNDCIKNPGLWRINDLFKLQGESAMGISLGEAYLQVKFMSESEKEKDNLAPTIPELQNDYMRLVGPLTVHIISAANLKDMDTIGGKSDPYCVAYLNINKNQQIETPVINNELNPVWKDFKKDLFIDVRKMQTENLNLIVEVRDYDLPGKSDLIGIVEVDLKECLQDPYIDKLNDYNIVNKKDINGTLKLALKWKEDNEKSEGALQKEASQVGPKKIIGTLHIKISNARQLAQKDLWGQSDPFCQLSIFPPSSKTSQKQEKQFQTEVIDNNINPDWKKNYFKIPIETNERDSKTMNLHVKVYDKGMIGKNEIGGVSISLKNLLENENAKAINDYYQLISEDNEKGVGFVHIQTIFLLQEDKEENIFPEPISFEEYKKSKEPECISGFLKVNIKGAKNLKDSIFDTPDPFCEIRLNKGDKNIILKTETKDDNCSPVYDISKQNIEGFQLSLPEEELKRTKLHGKLIDYDLLKNDIIGTFSIDLQNLFEKPYSWFNQFVQMVNEKGIPGAGLIYIQIQWRQDNTQIPNEEDLQDLMELEKQKQIEKEQQQQKEKQQQEEELKNLKKGKLFVYIDSAKNLPDEDITGKSDPYCVVALNLGAQKRTLTTPTLDNTIDPQWQYSGELEVALAESQLKQVKMSLKVMDKDTIGSDLLGSIVLDLDQVFEQPGFWLNGEYPLTSKKGNQDCGSIIIQAQWRPEGVQIDEKLPQIQLSSSQDLEKFKGELQIWIIEASNLQNKDIGWGNKSDPYVMVTLNKQSDKKELRTKVKNNDLNPKWNFGPESFNLELTEEQYQYCRISFDVKDEDDIGSDDFLGRTNLKLMEFLQKPGEVISYANLALRDEEGNVLESTLSVNIKWNPQNNWMPKSVLNDQKNQDQKQQKSQQYIQQSSQNNIQTQDQNLEVIKATGIVAIEEGYSDAFVKVQLGDRKIQETDKIKSINPEWNKQFIFDKLKINNENEIPKIYCEVYDYNRWKSNKFIGDFEPFSIKEFIESTGVSKIVQKKLINTKNNKETAGHTPTGEIFLEILFQ